MPRHRLHTPSLVLVAAFTALTLWSTHAPNPARGAPAALSIFPLKLGGKTWATGIVEVPGKKVGVGKAKDKNITAVLTAVLPDFAADFLQLDPSGRFFLHYDGKTSWRVATNAAGDNPTTLTGQVANDGTFWMFGEYDIPMHAENGHAFVTGKVKFERGTFNPKKVSGVVYFHGEPITSGLILKFKTLKALP